jgi:hypothetical protein
MVRPILIGRTRVSMSTETIFSEVDEELRRDRLRKLWRTAAPWVIGGAVGVVLIVAGYEGWQWWTKSQSAAWSDKFYAATDIAAGTDLAASEKALADLVTSTGGGYPTLARFRQAAALAQGGKIDEAVAAYDGLASSETNTHLRELALVLGANLLVDKGDIAAVQQRVGAMLITESSMRNAAREVVALTQYKAGQLDAALESFQAIVDDPNASRDLVGRIQIFISQLVAEGAKQKSAAVAAVDALVKSIEGDAAVDASAQLDVSAPAETSAASSAPAN